MVTDDEILSACVEHFNAVNKTVKLSDAEWTVISAIVAVISDKDIKILSMGTGSKCIGRTFMSPGGDVLNDSHAEVIARRGFMKYLYHQIITYNKTRTSQILIYDDLSYQIKNCVKFFFVTSMSPCGDASIMPKKGASPDSLEVTDDCNSSKRKSSEEDLQIKRMRVEKEDEVADIHRTGAKCLPDSKIQDSKMPGVLYHNIGAVRTKPGRGDPTLSLSCSDKMARWNAVGWQGALLSIFIKEPIFMEGIICGGGCPFSKESFDRAVNERTNRQVFVPVRQSKISFPYTKKDGLKPSSSSLIWSLESEAEVSVNGRKRGTTKKDINKKKGRTSVCKKELFLLFRRAFESHPDVKNIRTKLNLSADNNVFDKSTYKQWKSFAHDYQKTWAKIKEKCFKVWSTKPEDLLNFTAMSD